MALTWEQVDLAGGFPTDRVVRQFASIGAASLNAIAGIGCYQSIDAGLTWRACIPRDPPNTDLTALSSPIGNNQTIYLGNSYGLYRVSEINLPHVPLQWLWTPESSFASVSAIADFPYDSQETLFTIVAGFGGYKYPPVPEPALQISLDGQSWSSITGYPTTGATDYPTCIVQRGTHVLVGNWNQGVHASDDNLATIQFLGLYGVTIDSVAILQDPALGSFYFVATSGQGLYRAAFGSTVLQSVAPASISNPYTDAAVICIGSILIGWFIVEGIFYSLDAGRSWLPMQSGLPSAPSTKARFGQVGTYLLLSILTDTGTSALYRIDLSSLIS